MKTIFIIFSLSTILFADEKVSTLNTDVLRIREIATKPAYLQELLKGRTLYSEKKYIKAHQCYLSALKMHATYQTQNSKSFNQKVHYEVIIEHISDATLAVVNKYYKEKKAEEAATTVTKTLMFISDINKIQQEAK